MGIHGKIKPVKWSDEIVLITANQITKFHNKKCIFQEISFSIEKGEKIALIGVNGAGKSTFLRVVAQKENYEGETMICKKDLQISYLEQNPIFTQNLTIMEQVFQSVNDNKIETFEILSILSKLQIHEVNQKIMHLSGGQKKRVALAITLLKPCDLLILDEPTNHLDNSMIEWLEKYLIKTNKTILMVTHDRYFLNRITNIIYEIDHAKLYKYEANYARFLELKQQREENELASERKRHAFLRKEIEWVRAGVQGRGTKSRERLEKFERLNNVENIKNKENVKMISSNSRLGKKTIEWQSLGMSFGEKHLFTDFSYTLKKNDRIGIIGDNGSGKSTLLNIIAREVQPTLGDVIYGETVVIGYFKQGCESMDEQERVIDYIRNFSDDLATSEGHFSARVMLERFLFDSSLQYAKIAQLSGGEKRRLYLLKVLMQAPNILLFDEPTNDLDIETLAILEDYLDSFNGAIITISHDRYFLDRICDSLFVFEKGNISSYIGGYSIYLDNKEELKKKSNDGADAYERQKQETKKSQIYMSSKEKKELENMEGIILDIESKIEEIDQDMELLSKDFEKIASLSNKREEYTQDLEQKNERWFELLEKEELMRNQKK